MDRASRNAYDSDYPPAFIERMTRDWANDATHQPDLVHGAALFRQRRKALAKLFPGETLVIATGSPKIRSNDTPYRFRPGSNFYYLTGCIEPDCVLVLSQGGGASYTEILFVEPAPGKTGAAFFADRFKGELWTGPRLGVDGSRARYGVDETRSLTDLPAFRKSLETSVRFAGEDGDRNRELGVALSEMRLIKDPFELDELRSAIASTKLAFEEVIRALPRLTAEREVEALFNMRARVEGNDVGYNTTAAAGENACTIHYKRNDSPLRPGELLLIDAGVETKTLYTADITRTLPISGRFDAHQREIYELVLEAQRAAFAECRPGNAFLAPNAAAMRVLAHGLERLGVLQTGAEEALRSEHQFYRRYTLHNVSHMLGLDVHDCAEARTENYRQGVLRPGMVLTIEPGLYFQPDDLTVPPQYRGIAVRIEDDVAITSEGFELLSKDIPRDTDAVERWMSRLWQFPAHVKLE